MKIFVSMFVNNEIYTMLEKIFVTMCINEVVYYATDIIHFINNEIYGI